jgi:hypothetical protein
MELGKKITFTLKSNPKKGIQSGSDKCLVANGAASGYELVKGGGNPGYVGIQDVATGLYWTIEWRGPVGDLHGVTLKPKLDDGKLAPFQRFKLEKVSDDDYYIKESTKGEYVSVGHNDVIVRWVKGDGSTQIFTMK